ncbi:PREDICTED: POC1 centriolar protein homolog [Rhagoletis zephyria]|uniref:POC1 centriolar protein homolog n=1 Tax=Rhagoletis zephyria TaxID=28612 RepID=UPI00081133DC|nr:PREDICTED: POC1 centriolar protein homolog [Rhagoletis zephyria]
MHIFHWTHKWVRAAKFSPNGECVRTFAVGRGMGRQLAWHPDGNLVALALSYNRVKIFGIAEGELIQCIRRRRMMLHFTQVEISW